MPTSAPTRCPTCRQLVHGRCTTCNPAWSRQPEAWAGGSTREWRRFRLDWLADHPLCMDCDDLATIVCHKPGTDYTIDRCNPDAIEGQRCEPCDRAETGRQGARARRRSRTT